ncbi:MAG: DUF4271 domain-containing protein [Lutibacter sp.]|uniref:DUF4271 domain-containing protein n=1 Tax=Lutibacter sp. TaxID=1925666 RepID=UPI001825B004|nr:DUF4271 domain-containing protein [Lutibacter sp.]MBT8318309.1 DUF4271 domain-containing protein [Lutibacter sp.]NNJ59166.1 DUF4271 domain-containing protein [Lutibacter sp.]
MFEATKIIHQNSDWITLVLVFIFSVLSISKLFFKDKINFVSTFFFSQNYLSILYSRDKNNIINWFQGVFFMNQILTLSLLLYLGSLYFNMHIDQLKINDFLLLTLGVGLYFALRYLVGFILAYLFNFKKEFNKIAYYKISYMNNIILWILPFIVFSVYINQYKNIIVSITLVIFLLLLLLRYILVIINNKKLIFNNLFYFILYLCALEIAPLIIILKLTI